MARCVWDIDIVLDVIIVVQDCEQSPITAVYVFCVVWGLSGGFDECQTANQCRPRGLAANPASERYVIPQQQPRLCRTERATKQQTQQPAVATTAKQ